MKKLRYFAVTGLMATAMGAMAVPAKRTTFIATQPDGTQLTLTRAGDEFNKYFLTDDGQIVIGDRQNGYYFAKVDAASGRMAASDMKATDAADRTASQSAFVTAINREELNEAMSKTARMSRIAPREGERSYAPSKGKASLPAQSGIGLFPGSTFPKTGSPKGLIILVEYSDVKFNSSYDAGDYFRRMVNEKDFPIITARGRSPNGLPMLQ